MITTCTAPTTKYCPSCQTTKSVDDFYKKKAGENGGLQYECKRCQLERRRAPGAQTQPKAVKTAKPAKPAPNGSADALDDALDAHEPKHPRYSIVRNHSRRTGECSWGVLDSHPYDGCSAVVFIGSTLKDALEECERLNRPPQRWSYKKRGATGFVTNDEVEDDDE